jgi:hypothetical protein
MSVAIQTCDKQTVEAMIAANAQWRPALRATARLIFQIQDDNAVSQAH